MHTFRLTYDTRKVKAVLTIHKIDDPMQVTAQEALKFLDETGIIHGLNLEAIEKMVDEKKWDTPVLIAKGSEPINGQDGSLEYFFNIHADHTPAVRADGSVDFRNIKITSQVHKDEHLARVIHPTPGTPGENVFGVPLPPRGGKEVYISSGSNTTFTDDSHQFLKSMVNGHAEIGRDGSIKVVEVFTVKGDIDYNTGNIDFDGDLEIMGDVKSGFSVKATDNIEIMGTVEDATVEAQERVFVKGGYVGPGRGRFEPAPTRFFALSVISRLSPKETSTSTRRACMRCSQPGAASL